MLPNFYAADERAIEYELIGRKFNILPSDAVGIYSRDNDAPLGLRYSSDATYLFDIFVDSDNRLKAHTRLLSSHGVPNYLGGIVSADRSRIYWENKARPLPGS